jgi:hypothetical protein
MVRTCDGDVILSFPPYFRPEKSFVRRREEDRHEKKTITIAVWVAGIAGIPALPPLVGLAQRIFQQVVQRLPDDRFQNVGGDGENYVGFSCSTCGPQFSGQGFSTSVFPSHYAAFAYAVTVQKQALTLGLELSIYIPQYVSGNVVLGPAPDRMVGGVSAWPWATRC